MDGSPSPASRSPLRESDCAVARFLAW
jgi:hypothetical protein